MNATTKIESTGGVVEPLWSVMDVSTYLGVPVKTLYRWRTVGYGPTGRRVGKYVRYRARDVIAWVDALTDPGT
jgi:predicted DNA-binding transcriptional regulator AlpA